jgi:hypothetical protein
VESIKSTEWILFNQISGEVKDFVMDLHDQIGWPFKLKEPAYLPVSVPGEIAFAHSAREGCIDFCISDFGSDDRHILSEELMNLLRSRFPDITLDERAGL